MFYLGIAQNSNPNDSPDLGTAVLMSHKESDSIPHLTNGGMGCTPNQTLPAAAQAPESVADSWLWEQEG